MQRNPFARKSETKSIQKSESFFEKVDAAESETAHKKTRKHLARYILMIIHFMCVGPSVAKTMTKKDGPRQATLFGMMSKSTSAQKDESCVSETQSTRIDTQIETQIDTQITDSQITDVLMSDVGPLDDVSTQEDSQQRAYSPDWDETLLEDNSL